MVEPCGMFIDLHVSIFGTSSVKLIEDDAIVEVKNPNVVCHIAFHILLIQLQNCWNH